MPERPGTGRTRIGVEEYLQPARPHTEDQSDRRKRDQMRQPHRERPQLHRRKPPAQPQHEWSRHRPWQPANDAGPEQSHPRVVHPLPTHHKDRLHRIDQPEAQPDRCNPYPSVQLRDPSVRLRASGVRVHIEIVFYGPTKKAANAANHRNRAVTGLSPLRSPADTVPMITTAKTVLLL